MITDSQMDKAINYLAETDDAAAQAKARLSILEKQEKTVLGVSFLTSNGNNQEREYQARTSDEYIKWQQEHGDAVLEHETYRNKRIRAEAVIEVWRSINSNRRAGMIK